MCAALRKEIDKKKTHLQFLEESYIIDKKDVQKGVGFPVRQNDEHVGDKRMKIQPATRQETLRMAIGVAILTVLMVGIFLIIGMFDVTVLAGAAFGGAFAVLNFFLMALSVQKAAEMMSGVHLPPEEVGENGEVIEQPLSPEAAKARQKMQLSYTGRMLLTVVFAIIALLVPAIHPVAALIPLLFPRIVIMIQGLVQKNGKAG